MPQFQPLSRCPGLQSEGMFPHPKPPQLRFALGLHLFLHPLSPYDEKSTQDIAKLLPELKEQACTATSTTHLLFMAPFTPDELKNKTKKLLPNKSPGATKCYKPVTLTQVSNSSFSFSSTFMGIPHTTHRLATFSPTTYLQRAQQG